MIRAGEKVYDDNGEVIGEFASDINYGQAINSTDFILANGEHPEPHTKIHYKIVDFMESRSKEPK